MTKIFFPPISSATKQGKRKRKKKQLPIRDQVDLLRIELGIEQVTIIIIVFFIVVVVEKVRELRAEVGGTIEIPEIDIVGGKDIVHGGDIPEIDIVGGEDIVHGGEITAIVSLSFYHSKTKTIKTPIFSFPTQKPNMLEESCEISYFYFWNKAVRRRERDERDALVTERDERDAMCKF